MTDAERAALVAELARVDDAINAAHWIFTRAKRGKPPSMVVPEAYRRRAEIEARLRRHLDTCPDGRETRQMPKPIPPIDWARAPDTRRHAKPIEITLTEEDRAFVEKYGGGAGKSGGGKSAVIGAALRFFRKLQPREIVKEVDEEKERRRKKHP